VIIEAVRVRKSPERRKWYREERENLRIKKKRTELDKGHDGG
jgi:hypothetical protein